METSTHLHLMNGDILSPGQAASTCLCHKPKQAKYGAADSRKPWRVELHNISKECGLVQLVNFGKHIGYNRP
jgi:hypothetical protein